MKLKKKISKILQQVPPDYYQKSVSRNSLKKYWHDQKIITFKYLIKDVVYPSKILDVGCASGFMANRISEVFPNSKVYAIDAYKPAIVYGKKIYPHIKFSTADAHRLPYPKNTFDLVTCYETIEHVENPLKILSEIKRVIKPNKYALVAMDSGNIMFRLIWWISEKTISKVWQNAHLHPYNHLELEEIIKKSKFKVIKKHFSHFGMEVSFLLTK